MARNGSRFSIITDFHLNHSRQFGIRVRREQSPKLRNLGRGQHYQVFGDNLAMHMDETLVSEH